ncbi:phage holin family protein [Tissierella praeacuta]|uniref:phage holin family protein n=1 Tax=Tissierella praeacuta TaxID=43131 RepID=UPI0028A9F48F|nr:phage holin family protein [Tissierella praeacuta]
MENNFTIWIKRILFAIGGVITTILGGWDMLLKTLVGLVIADYILGVTAAGMNKRVDSSVCYPGIFKKVMLFIPIGICYSLDQLFGTEMLRNVSIWFYIGNEGISIVENLGKAGVPIPKFLGEALVQLRESSDKGEMIK